MAAQDFEIARLLLIEAFWADRLKHQEARIYAWVHRVFPLHARQLEVAFASEFEVGEPEVDAVMRWLDQRWRANLATTFYDLEQAFSATYGATTTASRVDLINICRAASLDRRFNPTFIANLTAGSGAPIEAQGLDDPFDPSEIQI